MTGSSDFITHGLSEARLALTNIIGMTNIHLKPQTLTRSLKRRAMARLVQLEIIVRRLLTLMALALQLAPVHPRARAVSTPLPDGVELISFPAPRRFALSARLQAAFDPDASVHFPCTVRACGPVPAAPFLDRVSSLYRVLAAPEVHARRLARSLERQKRRGDPRPCALPMVGTYRLRPELGIVATALPGMLAAALESWDNTS
ncbi:hypothetical protein [Hyphomonas johnsonii]|uniref:Uncharacterized protein n=1 Tax=Hyphomonas johnsonii MHS-2 TaxID=1280950 RepID=A0A059FRP4_9PROT|nr:hypothetical protein [Hyphomonas johnsonii]KCZ93339.1 hypothetical protein HJO_05770 [Hyphomonas johnsonii MHS-2]